MKGIFIALFILHFVLIYFAVNRKTIDSVPIYVISGKDYSKRFNRTVGIIKEMQFSNYKKWEAAFPENKKFTMNNKEHVCSLKKGAFGCSISHRTLWKHIYENHKGDEWVVIFEDDIMLPKNVKAQDVKQLMKKYMQKGTHDTSDVIYFGYCWTYLCTHAYAVTPKGAKILYDNTYNCIITHPQTIDKQMNTLRENNIVKVLRTAEYEKQETSWAEGLIHQLYGDSIIQSHN